MKCPYCSSEVLFTRAICEQCHQDLRAYRKIFNASNLYYNSGLERAKNRDLTGAIDDLKKSLKLNKKNIDALNLLGLIYCEIGELIPALVQWVISRNYQEENNRASLYLNQYQERESELSTQNHIFRKFNNALENAKKGRIDLALVQLERICELNPRYLKAQQLLALIYINEGAYNDAARCLENAKNIDKGNPMTLRYLAEIEDKRNEDVTPPDDIPILKRDRGFGKQQETDVIEEMPEDVAKQDEVEPRTRETGRAPERELHQEPVKEKEEDMNRKKFEPDFVDHGYTAGSPYKEERFNFMPYVTLIIGVILGVVIVYSLVVPTIRKELREEYQQTDNEAEVKEDEYQVLIDNQNSDIEQLKNQIEKLEKEKKNSQKGEAEAEKIITLLEAVDLYMGEDEEALKDKMSGLSEADFSEEIAKKIFNKIVPKEPVDEEDSQEAETLAEQGRNTYNDGQYEDARSLLQQALELDEGNCKALYFMGRICQREGQNAQAREYYEKIINEHPESDRVSEAQTRLSELD
ncbi:MAG: tetratricopeptide repeat protein [Lachnospiraceae bacterium]|nr:tetratricopeptide repeat protein [Lachnospiraceae bacterium]